MGTTNDTLSSGCSISIQVSLLVLHRTPFLVVYPSTVVMLFIVSDCVYMEDCGSDSLFYIKILLLAESHCLSNIHDICSNLFYYCN